MVASLRPDMLAGYADGLPDVEAAPMGAGFQFEPGATYNLFGTMYLNAIHMALDARQARPNKWRSIGNASYVAE